jgi:uncharacterized protein with von Willebrand factor type A (vWA) domain
MAIEAMVKNENGIKEGQGLSVLDVLKHAVKTIVYNLNENDRFTLISFSDISSIEFPLKPLSKENKLTAIKALDALEPDGQTNIWSGIKKGLDTLREGFLTGDRQSSIILLTDGEPNVFPPSGF